MGLQDIHHLVLQSCMSHRTLSETKAHAIYARCVALCYGRGALAPGFIYQGAGLWSNAIAMRKLTLLCCCCCCCCTLPDDEKPDFAQVMGDISHALEAYGFDIKKAQDEHTAKTWWSFVNTKSDELSKVATEYGPQEISYFRTLVRGLLHPGRTGETRSLAQRTRIQTTPLTRQFTLPCAPTFALLSPDQAHCKERQKVRRSSQGRRPSWREQERAAKSQSDPSRRRPRHFRHEGCVCLLVPPRERRKEQTSDLLPPCSPVASLLVSYSRLARPANHGIRQERKGDVPAVDTIKGRAGRLPEQGVPRAMRQALQLLHVQGARHKGGLGRLACRASSRGATKTDPTCYSARLGSARSREFNATRQAARRACTSTAKGATASDTAGSSARPASSETGSILLLSECSSSLIPLRAQPQAMGRRRPGQDWP